MELLYLLHIHQESAASHRPEKIAVQGDASSAPNENRGWVWVSCLWICHHTTIEELCEAGLAL